MQNYEMNVERFLSEKTGMVIECERIITEYCEFEGNFFEIHMNVRTGEIMESSCTEFNDKAKALQEVAEKTRIEVAALKYLGIEVEVAES